MKSKNKSIVGIMAFLSVFGIFASANAAARDKVEKINPKLERQAKMTLGQARGETTQNFVPNGK